MKNSFNVNKKRRLKKKKQEDWKKKPNINNNRKNMQNQAKMLWNMLKCRNLDKGGACILSNKMYFSHMIYWAHTNRYVSSPIPYFMELINRRLPQLGSLLPIFPVVLLSCWALFLCCLLLFFRFFVMCNCFHSCCHSYCNSIFGLWFCVNKIYIISYRIISYHI